MINLDAICNRVFQRHSKDIEALNKLQLSKGQLSDGTKLPAYKKSYLKTRRKHGRPTAPMDLNLKGDFYKGWFSNYFSSYMSIESRDGKGPIHEQRFGSSIYGLDEESMDTLLWQMGVADEIIDEVSQNEEIIAEVIRSI